MQRRAGGTRVQLGGLTEISLGMDQQLECVDKFWYLGDMIGAGGGAGESSRARVSSAWAKFRELAPILTNRGASLKVKSEGLCAASFGVWK